MDTFVLDNEAAVRLGSFAGALAAMVLWELLAPKRALREVEGRALVRQPRHRRHQHGTDSLPWLPPAPSAWRWWPRPGAGGSSTTSPRPMCWPSSEPWWLLDLAIYLQHVLFHAVPALWRLHRMHHSDLDFDTTTGFRFHPIEIALSMGIKMGVVAALGPPPVAVVAFEVVLNATSLFNHGNVRLPGTLDRALRWVVVTPDMHRVHHSHIPSETNSNFGFNLPWWDRLFGTYRDQPRDGHQGMTIGLHMFRDTAELHLHRLLVQPFLADSGDYVINRRRGR